MSITTEQIIFQEGAGYIYTDQVIFEAGQGTITVEKIVFIPSSTSSSTIDVLSVAKPLSLKTTKEINGNWSAQMQLLPDDYIGTENYIDFNGEEYIVKTLKKIKSGGKYYYDVSLYLNAIEELTNTTVEKFTLLREADDILITLLANTGWTIGSCDIDDIVLVESDRRISVLEAVNILADKCGGELYFHSKTRVLDLKKQIGNVTKLQIRYDKNSDYIEKQEDSSDLVTRIYPYGADGFTINTTILDDCEDETLYVASGSGTSASSPIKQIGTQGIQINPAAQNETFIRTLGTNIDLTGHSILKFWIYSPVGNSSGFTFGIGESAYTENVINTGVLYASCWKEVSLDLSGVADSSKNAIKYIGFKNLTAGAAEAVFDSIRAYDGNTYIDSPNIGLYKVNKEFVFFHSAKVTKTQVTATIYPSDDAMVNEGSRYTNYGKSTYIQVRDYEPDCLGYMKFNFGAIPTGATIVTATLNIKVFDKITGATCPIYQAKKDWSELTINYNNRPGNNGNLIGSIDVGNTVLQTVDVKTAVENWLSGAVANYGMEFHLDLNPEVTDKLKFYSKDNTTDKPYIEAVYTVQSDPEPMLKAAAEEYLYTHGVPVLKYKVKMADLSRVAVGTWKDEVLELGDTVRVYDKDLGINTDCRIVKITKDLLNPDNIDLELANKAYTIADIEAKRAKQLSYAMPFVDDTRIINANAIQKGYFGSDVNV